MADEPVKPPKIPPNLPPLAPGAPKLPPLRGGGPPLPGVPSLPVPGVGFPSRPAMPSPPGVPAAPGMAQFSPAAAGPSETERKIAELEKKLQQEREKVLVASLKSQEEAAVAARVETSIKEVQDKLRRDRREAEMEETRLKLEAKIQELENRLVQERETWVSTLKSQMQARENQDKDLESHFSLRMQEIERRWLDEKAHWQRALQAKDEQLRGARALGEQLQQMRLEREKLLYEKKQSEDRSAELAQVKAELTARLGGFAEREKDFFQMKTDLERSRSEMEQLRTASKEREIQLLADQERLRDDLMAATQRARAEYDAEMRQKKIEHESELQRLRAQADLANAALQKMRAVAGALERQVASLRVQAEEAQKLRAEFLLLKRLAQDREAQIRKELASEFSKQLEADEAKLKLQTQEEFQARILRMQEELRKALEEERLKPLREEVQKREALWQERLLKEEGELAASRAAGEELRSKIAVAENLRAQALKDKVELEKSLALEAQDVKATRAALEEANKKCQSLLEETKRLQEEQARLEETWRQRLELTRRELEERLKSFASPMPAETSLFSRLKRAFSRPNPLR